MAEFSPEELAYFDINRRRVNDSYGLGVGQNQFEQDALGAEKARQLTNLVQQLDQMREGIAGQFARGGTLNSGLYQKALSEYNTGRARQIGQLEGSFADRLNALVLAKQQLEQTRASALADVDQEEAARRAAIAASIQAATAVAPPPVVGGGAPTYKPAAPAAPKPTPRAAAPAPPPAPPAPAPPAPKPAASTNTRKGASGMTGYAY